MRFFSLLIRAIPLALLANSGTAALTIYTERADWLATVGAHQTETFESFTDFTELPLTGGTFSTPAFDILADANHGRIMVHNDVGDVYESPYLVGNYFVGDAHSPDHSHPHFNTITFVKPITAFAANFGAFDERGLDDIRIAGESLQLFPRFDNGHYFSNFWGVVSTTPFTVVDIRNANGKMERYGMDDVSYVTAPEPVADFNGDALVDAMDLEVWSGNFGLSPTATTQQGDGNHDGNVDGADFLIWQRAYSPATVGAVVPEPSAAWLILSVALTGLHGRRQFGF